MPYRRHYVVGVPYLDTFLLVGGHDGARALDTMYRYDADEDKFVLIPQKLSVPVHAIAAFAVDIDDPPMWN